MAAWAELSAAIQTTDGLSWMVLAALVAGLVRGFAGFGTAMVFLPVAGQFLSPFSALTALMVMDLIGPLPKLRSAMRDGHLPDMVRLGAGAVLMIPVGLWVLGQVDPEVFRYGVSFAALLLLILLASGVRYSGRMTPPLVLGTGGLGGLLAGLVGLPGPPVIFLYMASKLPPAAIRGNIYTYLVMVDVLILGSLWIMDQLVVAALAVGALLILPYALGVYVGAAIFRPEAETTYR
ncbi:MAG: TSUP family transporter, partial [Pseudomonadota bacterium]